MKQAARHIIFDLDGTLIDSRSEILATYESVFTAIKPDGPFNIAQIDCSLSIRDVLAQVYPSDDLRIIEAKGLFASIYDSSNYDQTSLYPAVTETLATLHQLGHRLYIATNKRYTPTLNILRAKGIYSYFTDVIGNELQVGIFKRKQEMIGELKQNNLFKDGIMVGDTDTDILSGRAEQLATIAVTYGYQDISILLSSEPTATLSSFDQILDILNKI